MEDSLKDDCIAVFIGNETCRSVDKLWKSYFYALDKSGFRWIDLKVPKGRVLLIYSTIQNDHITIPMYCHAMQVIAREKYLPCLLAPKFVAELKLEHFKNMLNPALSICFKKPQSFETVKKYISSKQVEQFLESTHSGLISF